MGRKKELDGSWDSPSSTPCRQNKKALTTHRGSVNSIIQKNQAAPKVDCKKTHMLDEIKTILQIVNTLFLNNINELMGISFRIMCEIKFVIAQVCLIPHVLIFTLPRTPFKYEEFSDSGFTCTSKSKEAE